MRETIVTGEAHERSWKRSQDALESFGSESPIVKRVVMYGKVHDRADQEDALRLKYSVHFLQCSVREFYMLQCVKN